jgi:formylglycine-generating enzyme required for sulfatase activity
MKGPVRIFVSYSRHDSRWLQQDSLLPWLARSLRRDGVEVWWDKEGLAPGDEFRTRIESEIDRSAFALLLVSQEFLVSDFIEKIELPRIQARAQRGEMVVIPILLEPCARDELELLSSRQMLPGKPTPLIDYVATERDWKYVRAEVLAGVRRAVSRLGVARSSDQEESKMPPNGDQAPRHESAAAKPPASFIGRQAPVSEHPVTSQSPVAVGATMVNPKDGSTYVWIPPGKFLMGCSPGDTECARTEKPAHEVTITKGFWIGQTPVTQAAYSRVMGKDPSQFKGASLPVEHVSWDDAKAYCEAVGGRLPTEAEWEYAARAGTTGERYGNLDDIAWYEENSKCRTHEVGQKHPNAFALYDMLGNVFQWTADWAADYSSAPQTDPTGPTTGRTRAVRGSTFNWTPRFVRVSIRDGGAPGNCSFCTGLRCVME